MVINIKASHYCGVCRYWYDPTNSAISPHNPNMNFWNMEQCRKLCMKKNLQVPSTGYCQKYECKLNII